MFARCEFLQVNKRLPLVLIFVRRFLSDFIGQIVESGTHLTDKVLSILYVGKIDVSSMHSHFDERLTVLRENFWWEQNVEQSNLPLSLQGDFMWQIIGEIAHVVVEERKTSLEDTSLDFYLLPCRRVAVSSLFPLDFAFLASA